MPSKSASINAKHKNLNQALAMLLAAAAGYVLSMFYRVSVTVISPELTTDLQLSSDELSALSAAFFYAFAASQIPLGMVLDRYGARKVMIVLAAVAVAGSVVFGLAHSTGQALLGRVLMGVGMSCNMMGVMVLVGTWFPPSRFATLTGIMISAGCLGQVLAATPLVLLTQAMGWRGAFLVIAAINAAQGVALVLLVRDRPPGVPAPQEAAGDNPLKGLGQVLISPYYWISSFASFFRYGSMAALQGLWAGPYLIYGLGLDPVTAGNILVALAAGYMLGLPVSGRISDHMLSSRRWVIAPSLIVLGVLTLCLGWLPRDTPVIFFYVLFFALGFFSGPGQVMYPHIKELLPPHLAARAMTGLNLFTMLGPAVVMQLCGMLVTSKPEEISEPAGFWPIWIFMAVVLFLGGLGYWFIPDTRPRDQKEASRASVA